MSNKSESNYKVLLAVIVAHSFWGFSFLASRVALDWAHMFILLSHRFVIAFLTMSIMAVLGNANVNLRNKSLIPILFLGLMEPIVYFLGEQYGILHSNTIFSGVMIAMIPIASTIAAMVFLREIPTIIQFIFGIVSVAGVIGIGLISSNSGALDIGGVIGLIIAVLAAVAYNLIGRRISQEYTAFERTYGIIIIGAIFFTILSLIHCKGNIVEYVKPLGHMDYLLSILFLAICCSVGSYFLNAYAITHLSVTRTTVFANLTTAVSVFAGAVFLHEPFSPLGLVFCAMILIGIYGVQREDRKE